MKSLYGDRRVTDRENSHSKESKIPFSESDKDNACSVLGWSLPRPSLKTLETVDTDLAGGEDERAREVKREPALKDAGLCIFSL